MPVWSPPAPASPCTTTRTLSVGDVVVTRRNDRRLRTRTSWVRNGDRWTVVKVRGDGSVGVRPVGRRLGGVVVLPAAYVAGHVELGYAVTAHRAQGITVDTAHTVITGSSTRESLYVSMTRGRQSNIAYVTTDHPDPGHAVPHPADDPGKTARSVLTGVLAHVGAEQSAHAALRTEQDRWGGIAQLAAEYDTIATAAQHDRWVALIRSSPLTADQADAVVASDAFGPLTATLRRAEAHHHDVDTLLPRVVTVRGFEDADDIAAVLDARIIRATTHRTGSGRARLRPRLIAGLIPDVRGPVDAEMRQALDVRARLIEQRAAALADAALRDRRTVDPRARHTAERPASRGSVAKPSADRRLLTASGTRSAGPDRSATRPSRTHSAPTRSTQQPHLPWRSIWRQRLNPFGHPHPAWESTQRE